MLENTGAGEWNRTTDLRFTKPLNPYLKQPNAIRNNHSTLHSGCPR